MLARQYVTSLSTGAIAFAATLTLSACSGTSSTSPTSAATTLQVSEDVAEASASDVTGDVTETVSAEGNAGVASVTPYTVVAAGLTIPGRAHAETGCTLGSTTGFSTFPAADLRDSVYYSRTWEFFSASGCENAYVPGTTDSIQYIFSDTLFLNGKAEHWHGHRYANRMHWLTADTTALGSALNGPNRFWNGSGTIVDTVNFTHPKYSANYTWTASDTSHNISFPHPRAGDLYPTGGTWTRWLNGSGTFSGGTSGTITIARHIVVSFTTDQSTGQGSVDATLQIYDVNTDTLVRTCTVDLSLGQIVPGSCH